MDQSVFAYPSSTIPPTTTTSNNNSFNQFRQEINNQISAKFAQERRTRAASPILNEYRGFGQLGVTVDKVKDCIIRLIETQDVKTNDPAIQKLNKLLNEATNETISQEIEGLFP